MIFGVPVPRSRLRRDVPQLARRTVVRVAAVPGHPRHNHCTTLSPFAVPTATLRLLAAP